MPALVAGIPGHRLPRRDCPVARVMTLILRLPLRGQRRRCRQSSRTGRRTALPVKPFGLEDRQAPAGTIGKLAALLRIVKRWRRAIARE